MVAEGYGTILGRLAHICWISHKYRNFRKCGSYTVFFFDHFWSVFVHIFNCDRVTRRGRYSAMICMILKLLCDPFSAVIHGTTAYAYKIWNHEQVFYLLQNEKKSIRSNVNFGELNLKRNWSHALLCSIEQSSIEQAMHCYALLSTSMRWHRYKRSPFWWIICKRHSNILSLKSQNFWHTAVFNLAKKNRS